MTIELRERTQEIKKLLTSGKSNRRRCCPRRSPSSASRWTATSASGRSSIRTTISNPDQFSDEMLEAYDTVQRALISTGLSWRQVPIPPIIYDAVRKLYPESRPPFRARCF